MDDGEVDFYNQDIFPSQDSSDHLLSSCSMDSFFDEILKDTHACTHTHTCNPPGPDASHTHTCFHVHTKILSGPSDDKVNTDETAESTEKISKKRPLGNREAVRKYREKKKARAASLEDEVVRLRAVNQQLMKRLHAQPALEAEMARLKCLLVDIRGRIEGEIGSFPYQRIGRGGDGGVNLSQTTNFSGEFVFNSCDLRCNDQLNCMNLGAEGSGLGGSGFGACDIGNIQHVGNLSSGSKDFSFCGNVNNGATGVSSATSKRKGTR